MSLLQAALTKAYDEEKINADLMPRKIIRGKELRPPRAPVTDETYAKILATIDDPDFRDIVVCAWESAMRGNEILGLTRSQVCLDTTENGLGFISLGIFDTKNQTERTVPVSPALKKILQKRCEGLEDDAYVFPLKVRSGGRDQAHLDIRLKKACRVAGIPYGDKLRNAKGERIGMVFHRFRHTRISRWVAAGFSDEIIRRASGHNSLAAFRKYVHLEASAVLRLVTPVAQVIEFPKPRIAAPQNENGINPVENPREAATVMDS